MPSIASTHTPTCSIFHSKFSDTAKHPFTTSSLRQCFYKSNLQWRFRKPNLCKYHRLVFVYNKLNGRPKDINLEAADKSGSYSANFTDSLRLLEWPKLCEAVAAFAGTQLGKEALKDQLCSLHLSPEQSEALLSETDAGFELLKYSGSTFDFSGLNAVEAKSAIDRLGRGFAIDGKEALAIAALLQFCDGLQAMLKAALKEDAEWYTRFMPLSQMLNEMVINQALVRTILQIVDEEGLVKDDASSVLKQARNQVRKVEQRVYQLLNSILLNGRDENCSQEISYIDGRWCIRSDMEVASDFQGLLLWSGSGAENYLEPVSAVPLNDELAQARALVSKAELEALADLTEKVLPQLDDIKLLLISVVQLDVIMSRAKYSMTFGGTRPLLDITDANGFSTSQLSDADDQHSTDGNVSGDNGEDWRLHLRKLYHPLLLQQYHDKIQKIKQKINSTASQLRRTRLHERNFSSRERIENHLKFLESKVATLEANPPIPIDILIRRKTKVLIITGPNTGGKTATIKTVGLAALMAKCGLYLLAAEPVKIPFFDSVFADIGDEQSLSQSLSTFSGHLQQIKGIRAQSTGRSLVLLDEVGAGTNPLEGAALGISLLESFADSGSLLTIATTHQGELKTLKYSNDRFENACVEFDEENLRPTYKLLWGIPGRSNAISIAERLGLPTHILDNAQQLYGKDSAEINKVIIDLENAKQDFQEDLLATEYYLRQSRILYQRLVAVNDKVLEYSTFQQYRKMHEIFAAVADARSALHRKMRNFRESTSKVPLAVAHSLRDDRTGDLNVSVESSTDRLPGKTNQVPNVGQVLHLPSFGQKVKVLKVNEDKNELLVQSGNLKFKLSLSEWRT